MLILPQGGSILDAHFHRRFHPLFAPEQCKQIVQTIETSVPKDNGLIGHGWTVKKMVALIGKTQDRFVCRNTIRKILRQGKLSWKKCKKLWLILDSGVVKNTA